MKRVCAVVLIAAVAALGLSDCSSDSELAEEPAVEETSAASEEVVENDSTDTEADADTDTDVASAEACLALTEPLQQTNTAMLAIAQDSTNDPENTVAMWRALSEAFEDFGESARDPELAALSTEVGEHAHALTDVMEVMYVDGDYFLVDEFDDANDAFFESYEKLLETCTPELP